MLHNAFSVPYRGAPKYNSRRKLSRTSANGSVLSGPTHGTLVRQNSQSSLASSARTSSTPMMTPQPNGVRFFHFVLSVDNALQRANGSVDYGTLRKFTPESVSRNAGDEANIPRIMVIPRGPKGFGFILRGTKRMLHVH